MFLKFAAAAMSLSLLPSIASACAPAATMPARPEAASALVRVQATADALGVHAAIAWAKARLSEMDAIVTTLEEDAGKLRDDARRRADETIAMLRSTRQAYGAKVESLYADGKQQTEAILAEARAALDARWSEFERELDGYLTTINSEIALRKAVFEARVKAQETYWRQAIADLKASAASVAAERRAALEARIAAVQIQADAARMRLFRLQQAGGEAWSALRDGLAEARGVFDRTQEAVRAAIERARQ
jgi:hypothetical protein